MELATLLLVLAVGLVVGGVAVVAYYRMNEHHDRIEEALAIARSAREEANDARRFTDKLNTHDHEIATLFDRQGLRRQ